MSWFWSIALAVLAYFVLVVLLPTWISYWMLGRGNRALNALHTGEAEALAERISRRMQNLLLIVGTLAAIAFWLFKALRS